MKDLRDYLSKQLAELADSDAGPEDMALRIERAKATSQVADTYMDTVKLELAAVALYERTGMLPESIESATVKQIGHKGGGHARGA